ncbi:hypothetical protein ACVWZ3_001218 [Bradyrhizobium sp. i1.3.6]
MNISVHAEADITAVAHNDLANAVRFLAVDAIETSQSGHPGLPMGMADVATVLFSRFLKFDSAHPNWPDRDRFVLSAGHGSMLLYALLHLTGGDVSLDDIKAFRQWGSKTPGHPEYGHTPGVETTTGPLGQGIATAGRHGARRAHGQCTARRRPGRSLHLCDRGRRLPDGRHQPGGDLARRSSPARPFDCAVRRQRHLHRRADLAGHFR